MSIDGSGGLMKPTIRFQENRRFGSSGPRLYRPLLFDQPRNTPTSRERGWRLSASCGGNSAPPLPYPSPKPLKYDSTMVSRGLRALNWSSIMPKGVNRSNFFQTRCLGTGFRNRNYFHLPSERLASLAIMGAQ